MLSAICRKSQNQNYRIRSKILESFPTISAFNIVHHATDCNPLRWKNEKFCIFPNLPTRNLVTLSIDYFGNRFHISLSISTWFQNALQTDEFFRHTADRHLGIGPKHAAVSTPVFFLFESSHLYMGVTVSGKDKLPFFILQIIPCFHTAFTTIFSQLSGRFLTLHRGHGTFDKNFVKFLKFRRNCRKKRKCHRAAADCRLSGDLSGTWPAVWIWHAHSHGIL